MLGEAALLFAGMVLLNGGLHEIAKAIRESRRAEDEQQLTTKDRA